MNLSQDNRTPTGGRAGGDGIGAVANSPAHTVGAVGFGPAWQDDDDGWVQLTEKGRRAVTDSMAASIVRLEQELEEANARIAVLEEEQRILAKGFPSPAKAAVIEGVEPPCGVSAQSLRERPEPSPHLQRLARIMMEFDLATGHGETMNELLSALREELADKWRWFDSEVTHARNERDEARMQYQTTHLLAEALAQTQVELKAERDAWKQCATGLADAVDYYHPALRNAEDGFSAERAAIARFDELEAKQ